MNDQQSDRIETLTTSAATVTPDPTAEEAQRTLEQANNSTASPPARQEAQPDETDRVQVKPFVDETRNAIAKDWRSRRAEQMRGGTEDFNDARLADPVTRAEDEQALLEAAESGKVNEQQTQPSTQQTSPDQQKVKVKVDGKEIEVSMAELVRTYQVDKTADSRLQAATEAKRAAEALLAKVSGQAGDSPTKTGSESESDEDSARPTSAKPASPTPDGAGVSDDDLMEVVENFMTGSTEEAFKALKKVVRPASQPQAADIATQVDKAIALRDETRKSAAALDKFGEKYKTAISDRIVGAALSQAIRDEMVTDLKSAAIVDDAFVEKYQLSEPQGLALLKEIHKVHRAAGAPGIRDTESVLAAVENNPTFKRLVSSVQPQPTVVVDRGGRKEAVQAQPALRSAQPQVSAPGVTRPASATDRAAKASQAVENMRKARNQSAYGA